MSKLPTLDSRLRFQPSRLKPPGSPTKRQASASNMDFSPTKKVRLSSSAVSKDSGDSFQDMKPPVKCGMQEPGVGAVGKLRRSVSMANIPAGGQNKWNTSRKNFSVSKMSASTPNLTGRPSNISAATVTQSRLSSGEDFQVADGVGEGRVQRLRQRHERQARHDRRQTENHRGQPRHEWTLRRTTRGDTSTGRMNNKFDDLLTELGTGKWNMLYFLVSSLWCFLVPPHFISGVYLAPSVNYTCSPPESENVTEISEDSCSYLVSSSSSVEPQEKLCTEWDFDTSVFTSTLTSEFSLVCKRESMRATYQGVYMLGTFISPLLGGYLADRYGRKVVVVVIQAVFTLTTLAICLLTNFTAILVFRFFMGSVNLLTFFILSLEVCEPKHRATVGILIGLPWALGTMAWGGMAYLIRDWRWLQFAVSFPNLLVFLPLFFLDESPRWLILRGYHDRAHRALYKAARWNNATLPPEDELRSLMMDIQEESSTAKKDPDPVKEAEVKNKNCGFLTVPDLFRTRAMAVITIIVCLDYFAVSLVFDGLNLSGDIYSADPFVYIVLSGLVEVPGYTITAPIINHWGRRTPTALSYLICGLVILALAFIPPNISWLVTTLAMVGKLCISGAYQMISLYSSELFPTEVRLQGIGAASVCSQLASTILPYITTFLGPLIPWAPSVIFGAVSVLAAVATVPLRETKGFPLPDTITDITKNASSSKEKKGGGAVEDVQLQDF